MTKLAVYGTALPNDGVRIWDSETRTLLRVGEAGWREPDWAPNGDSLTCVGYLGQTPGILVLDSLGAAPRVIVSGFDWIASPTWSPSGRRIAFCARSGAEDFQLYVVDSDGTGLRRITSDGAGPYGVAWSPSGREILYVRYDSRDLNCAAGNYVHGTLWRDNPSTGERIQVTFNHGVQCP